MKQFFDPLKRSICLASILVLSACDGGSSQTNENDTNATVQPPSVSQPAPNNPDGVRGGVTKGVLVSATVNAYSLALDGSIDFNNILATGVTDEEGIFSLNLPPDRGYLFLQSFGGEFIDETDLNPIVSERRKIVFTDQQGLKAVLPPTYNTIAITMTTDALYQKTLREFSNDFYTVFEVNVQNFAQGLGFNPLDTISADPNAPDPTASESARQYALLSGGLANISNQAAISNGFSRPNYEIIMAVTEDFSDGNIDGTAGGEPVSFIVDSQSYSLPTDMDLDNAINRFRNNNFQSYQSTPLPVVDYTVLASTGQLNTPPTLSIAGPTNTPAGVLVTLNANAFDDDGTVDSYQWLQTSGTAVTLSGAQTDTISFNAPVSNSSESLSFSLTATDDSALQTSANHTIIIDQANGLTVSAGADFQVSSDASVVLSGFVSSDPYVSTSNVIWTQLSGQSVTLVNPNQISGVSFTAPRVALDMRLEFELTITDSLNRVTSDRIIVTVLEYINLPPTISAGNDQNIDEQTLTTLNASASDVDGTVVSLNWTQTAGTSVALSNPAILNPTFATPAITVDESLVFELLAIDDDGASAIDSVTINVIANLAPVMSAGPDQTVDEQTTVNLAGSASDSDGTIATILWTQTGGTSISLSDASSLTPFFVAPDISLNEALTFNLTVTDNDGDSSSDTVSINLIANLPPVISAGVDQIIDEQILVNLAGSASDSDGTIATISWSQISGTSASLSSTVILTPSFTAPDVSADEALVFQLAVTDNDGDTSTDTVSINLVANLPPVISAGGDQTVNENSSVSLSGSASDSDGTISTIGWTQIAGTSVTLSDSSILNPSFTAPDLTADESLIFQLAVTDNDGDTSTDSVSINVNGNIAPTMSAGADQTVNEQSVVTLNGSASDADGTITSTVWSQSAGTSVTLSNNNILTPSFSAPDISIDETLNFDLTVTDDFGESVTDSVSINIIANLSATLSPTADQTVTEGAVVTLAANAVDPESGPLSIQWTQLTGTIVQFNNDLNDSITFSTPDVSATETLSFFVNVTDDIGNISSATINLTVTALTNVLPNISNISSGGYSANESVVISAFATDSDGTIASYLWEQVSGTAMSLSGTATSTLTFTTPAILSLADTLVFRLTVTDNSGGQAVSYQTTYLEPTPLLLSSLSFTDPNLSNCVGSYIGEIADYVHELFNLSCSQSSIVDLNGLEQLAYLESLNLSGNAIIDITSIKNLNRLQLIDLDNNTISNHNVLTSNSIKTLSLYKTGLNDLSFMTPLTQLVSVNIGDNIGVTDLSPLSNHLGMQFLNIDSTGISDITVIGTFKALYSMSMNNLGITDVSSLNNLTHLTNLSISDNGVTDLSSLSAMTKLTNLTASNNGMVNLAPLSTLTLITDLDLSLNSIVDVSVMSNFTAPKNIYLQSNLLNDLSVFFTMFSLQNLDLSSNPNIDCIEYDSLEQTLSSTTMVRPAHCPAP